MTPDTLQVVSDSALVAKGVMDTFPGIAPALVGLIASWLATRAIWLVKLLIQYGPVLLKLDKDRIILTKLQGYWTKVAWIVNPLALFLIMHKGTHNISLSALLTFAGIGVKEWLGKSPIPTSVKELKQLKAALIIPVLLLFAVPCFSAPAPDSEALKLAKEVVAQSWGCSPAEVSITKIHKLNPLSISTTSGIGRIGNEYYGYYGGTTGWLFAGNLAAQYRVVKHYRLNSTIDHQLGLTFIF